jgi:redox-sensitive bicupin YhaK (pirin superfamily)
VLVGELAGVSSPARCDTDHVGAELELRPGRTTVPLRVDFEHALVVLTGATAIDGHHVTPGHLVYLGFDRDEIVLSVREPTRALLIGGVPFDEPVLMWWNYVARGRDEIIQAHADWTAANDRFGHVASTLPRIQVGPPPWSR